MTPQEISSCSLREVDAFGTEIGRMLSTERLVAFLSAVVVGFIRKSTGSPRGQLHLAPEALMFVHRMNDCVGVLDAMAHGDIADGHKRQMQG